MPLVFFSITAVLIALNWRNIISIDTETICDIHVCMQTSIGVVNGLATLTFVKPFRIFVGGRVVECVTLAQIKKSQIRWFGSHTDNIQTVMVEDRRISTMRTNNSTAVFSKVEN